MMDLGVDGSGRVRIASLTVLNNDGVEDCVGIQVESNAEDGWTVLSLDAALDLASKLMVHVAGDA